MHYLIISDESFLSIGHMNASKPFFSGNWRTPINVIPIKDDMKEHVSNVSSEFYVSLAIYYSFYAISHVLSYDSKEEKQPAYCKIKLLNEFHSLSILFIIKQNIIHFDTAKISHQIQQDIRNIKNTCHWNILIWFNQKYKHSKKQ